MEIKEKPEGNLTTIELHGSLIGGKDSDQFIGAIKKCVAEGNTKILIDAAGMDYLNSTGLGALFAGFLAVKKAGGTFVIANATPLVLEILQLTKTDKAIPVYKSVGDARELL